LLIGSPSTLVGSFDKNCITCRNGETNLICFFPQKNCERNYKIFWNIQFFDMESSKLFN
jgi:hypothetical protein